MLALVMFVPLNSSRPAVTPRYSEGGGGELLPGGGFIYQMPDSERLVQNTSSHEGIWILTVRI